MAHFLRNHRLWWLLSFFGVWVLVGCSTAPCLNQENDTSAYGASVIQAQAQGIHIIKIGDTVRLLLPVDRMFYPNSANRLPESAPVLAAAAAVMQHDAMLLNTVRIMGYTDNQGATTRLDRLSMSQANAVLSYLTHQGLSGQWAYADGKGPTSFIGDNQTEAGRAANRRVEVVYRYVHF